MRIGVLSELTGVSVRSLRYYEEQDLLHPTRSRSGYRIYAESDLVRVQRIQMLLAAGLSTRTIEHIVPCLAQHQKGVGLACADMYDDLLAQRDGLLRRIDALRESVEALDGVISASPRPERTSD